MDETHWQRIRAFLEELDELSPEEREARLAELEREDPPFAAELRPYVSDEGVPTGFIQPPRTHSIESVPAAAPLALGPGSRLGPYELVRCLGSGGMGAVYEAVQRSPERSVALKVLRMGLATPGALRRFEVEAEILASLRHPAIAQVYESGVHREEGTGYELPWFAMELVPRACSLLEYADREELGLRARLELFLEVCAAVQHGHQRGVLHRDLKPSNLLVDEEGRPKVIDFGVARATDVDVEATRLTETGEIVGTLTTMSPEQFEGDPNAIDLRCDVYSLGVVLYELLTGESPYDLSGKSLFEAARVVRETSPTPPHRHAAVLTGDLEWILLKALEKEPERRYGTVSELAADLTRHLRNEPVEAGPPSTVYRLGKFVRRNRVLVSSSAAVFLAVTLGLYFSLRGLMDAREARDEAWESEQLANENFEKAALEARQKGRINRFLEELLLAPSSLRSGRDVRVADLLDEARDELLSGFDEEPEVRVFLLNAVAGAYYGLALYPQALELLEPLLVDTEAVHGPLHANTLSMRGKLAMCRFKMGEVEGIEEELLEVQDLVAEHVGTEGQVYYDTMASLGQVVWKLRRHEDALAYFEESIRLAELLPDRDVREIERHRSSIAFLLAKMNRHEEAQAIALDSWETLRDEFGENHLETLWAYANLAKTWVAGGRFAEAQEVLGASIDGLLPYLGEDHPSWLGLHQESAEVALMLNQPELAEEQGRLILERFIEVHGELHPETASATAFLASVLRMTNQLEEAEQLYERAHAVNSKLFGDGDQRAITNLFNLARIRQARGVEEGLEELYLEIVEQSTADGRPPSTLTTASWNTLGKLYRGKKQYVESEEAFRKAIEVAREVLPPDHPWFLDYRGMHAHSLIYLERYDEAEPVLKEVEAGMVALYGEGHPGVRFMRHALADLCDRQGRAEDATFWREKVEPAEASSAPAGSAQED